MNISIITGNKNKFDELKEVLGHDVVQLDIDVHEIQELDPYAVIRHKILEALPRAQGECVVDDTSLYLECFDGKFPGPLIKWFVMAIGIDGLVAVTKKMGSTRAVSKTILGYAGSADNIQFFEGVVEGSIVASRGSQDFSWGCIFQPDGSSKTFGEMTRDEKYAISMRGIAARKLKEYIDSI